VLSDIEAEVGRALEELADELTDIINEIESMDDAHMVPHTYGRLSFSIPASFTEEIPGAFVGRRIIVAFNLMEDRQGFDRAGFGNTIISHYTEELGFELADGPQETIEFFDTTLATSPFENLVINGVSWGRIDMTSDERGGQSLFVYFMTSGEQAYFIDFLLPLTPTAEDMAMMEGIINSVTFDDSHHKAEVQGVWRGVNAGSGYIVFDGDTFYWYMAYGDGDNVFIGNYHVRKGFTGGGNILLGRPGRFELSAFVATVIYTDAFMNGESVIEDFWEGQSFIFFPRESDPQIFDVEVQPGHLEMAFERVDASLYPATTPPAPTSQNATFDMPFIFDDLEITLSSNYSWVVIDESTSVNDGEDVIRVPITITNVGDYPNWLSFFSLMLLGPNNYFIDDATYYFGTDDITYFGRPDILPGETQTGYLHILYVGDGDYLIEFTRGSIFTEITDFAEVRLPIVR